MDIAKLNLISDIEGDFTLQQISDTDELQLNFVRLKAGASLPAHNANSNVRLMVLEGELTVTLNETEHHLPTHNTVATAFNTPMQIQNRGDKDAAFLVIKTPNPRVME